MGTLDAVHPGPGAHPVAGLRTKLSVMMFLEFFIWGSWLPLIFGYLPALGFSTDQQSWVLNAFALASFTAMFFSTQFADRNFSGEKFMAFSHLIGGAAILALGFVTDFWPFFLLMLLHSLFYVPTISISNAVAFASLKDAQRDFGFVRLWGTIGWIVASWPFVFILTDWDKVAAAQPANFIDWLGLAVGTPKEGAALVTATSFTFIAAGVASLLLAGFSLALPHTPPRPAAPGGEQFAWLEAFKLLRVPFLLILFVVTFIDAMVHQGYFVLTGTYLKDVVKIPAQWVMPVMSIGQIAEIGTMAVLGFFLKRLGWRWTMVIGVLGHTVRFGVFALCPDQQWLVILVNVLHGICYAFFFATVYIFVDEFFPKDARNSAQGLFNFLILGLGPFVANFLWPYLRDRAFLVDEKVNYRELFLVPAGIGLVGAILLMVFFHPPAKAQVSPVHGLGDAPGPVEEGIMAAKGHPSS
jgi:nucleoside transporter